MLLHTKDSNKELIYNKDTKKVVICETVGSKRNIESYFDKAKEKVGTVSSYQLLISELRKASKEKIIGHYLVVLNNDEFWFFRSYAYSSDYNLITVYSPETDALKEELKTILKLDTENYRILNCSKNNGYQCFGNLDILNIVLAKRNVESKNEKIYTKFRIPKKSGGTREIVAPHDEIKCALRKLNGKLQWMYDSRNEDFQIAYKKGKSIKTGALIHKDHQYVYNIDLKDFYPSCKKELIEKYLEPFFKASYNRLYLEKQFYEVILENDGLFIGNPISGTLLNVVTSNAVKYMKNICDGLDMGFSVYADDMTFSSNKFIEKDFILNIFATAFENYNLADYFKINEKKCEGASKQKRSVTGAKINGDNQVTMSRKYYRLLRTNLHKIRIGEDVDVETLRGKIAYATMIDDSGKIYRLLNNYSQEVNDYNLCSDRVLNQLKEKFEN